MAFLQHIDSLIVVEVLEDVLGINVIERIVRERERFPRIKVQGPRFALFYVHISIQPLRKPVRSAPDLQFSDLVGVQIGLDSPISPEVRCEDGIRQAVEDGLFDAKVFPEWSWAGKEKKQRNPFFEGVGASVMDKLRNEIRPFPALELTEFGGVPKCLVDVIRQTHYPLAIRKELFSLWFRQRLGK